MNESVTRCTRSRKLRSFCLSCSSPPSPPLAPQVHAKGGDRSEAQHGGAAPLHPRPQREDLPVPGDERRVPDGVATGRACAAAAASA